jgi:hypothetical protein
MPRADERQKQSPDPEEWNPYDDAVVPLCGPRQFRVRAEYAICPTWLIMPITLFAKRSRSLGSGGGTIAIRLGRIDMRSADEGL